ncbi:MAG: hypothetical protein HW416_3441 [Chloroflexi bacterium]|nr:hypothetical protein [Chloroflexota bacterium]
MVDDPTKRLRAFARGNGDMKRVEQRVEFRIDVS